MINAIMSHIQLMEAAQKDGKRHGDVGMELNLKTPRLALIAKVSYLSSSVLVNVANYSNH